MTENQKNKPKFVVLKQTPKLFKEVHFQAEIEPSLPAVSEHVINGVPVMPAAAHITSLLRASAEIGLKNISLKQLILMRPLSLDGSDETRVYHLALSPQAKVLYDFQLSSTWAKAEPAGQIVHASGSLGPSEAVFQTDKSPVQAMSLFVLQGAVEQSANDFYQLHHHAGIDLGPTFQWIEKLWLRDGEAWCEFREHAEFQNEGQDFSRVGLIDSCFQLAAAVIYATGSQDAFLPFSIEETNWHLDDLKPRDLIAHIVFRRAPIGDTRICDIQLFSAGRKVVEFSGFCCKKAATRSHPVLSSQPSPGSPRPLIPEGTMYEIQWKQSLAPAVHARSNEQRGVWVVMGDSSSFTQSVANSLRNLGNVVVKLSHGAEFSQSLLSVTVRPEEKGDIAKFMKMLKSEFKIPILGFVDLWPCQELTVMDKASLQEVSKSAEVFLGGLLHLCQAILSERWKIAPKIWVVTRGAHAETRGSNVIPMSSAVWNMGRVVGSEIGDLWGGMIDVDSTDFDVAARLVLAELTQERGSQEVKYLGQDRFVPEMVSRKGTDRFAASEFKFASDETCVITGGLGSLGLRTARWAVERGARKIALLSRSQPSADARRIISDLEVSGAVVRFYQVDIADRAQLNSVFSEIRRQLSSVMTLFHLAGVVRDSLVVKMPWSDFAEVIKAKILGSVNLHQLTLDDDVRHFVLFSSVAGLVGTMGQANYAGGNGFLDGLAFARQASGRTATTLNWGPWAGGGMAAKMSNSIYRKIDEDVAFSVVDSALVTKLSQVIVMPLDPTRFKEVFSSSKPPTLLANLFHFSEENLAPRAAPAASLQAPMGAPKRNANASVDLVPKPGTNIAPKAAMMKDLEKVVITVLGLRPGSIIDPNMRFGELGLDSLLSIDLVKALQMKLESPLPATLVFEYPNLEQLTNYVMREFGGQTDQAAEASVSVLELPKSPEVIAVAKVEVGDSRKAELMKDLEQVVITVLGLRPGSIIDPNMRFGELGLDSLLSIDLVKALQTKLESPLPATLAFEYPNLAQLTDYVMREFGGQTAKQSA